MSKFIVLDLEEEGETPVSLEAILKRQKSPVNKKKVAVGKIGARMSKDKEFIVKKIRV